MSSDTRSGPAVAISSTVTGAPAGLSPGAGAATTLGTLSNVPGTDNEAHRGYGQTMTKARPITFSIGTGPWQRASCDTSR